MYECKSTTFRSTTTVCLTRNFPTTSLLFSFLVVFSCMFWPLQMLTLGKNILDYIRNRNNKTQSFRPIWNEYVYVEDIIVVVVAVVERNIISLWELQHLVWLAWHDLVQLKILLSLNLNVLLVCNYFMVFKNSKCESNIVFPIDMKCLKIYQPYLCL